MIIQIYLTIGISLFFLGIFLFVLSIILDNFVRFEISDVVLTIGGISFLTSLVMGFILLFLWLLYILWK